MAAWGSGLSGAVFVLKKDGRLRLVLDTRVANCWFKDPPKARLPTASALCGIEAAPGQDLYFAGGDIDNCFYRFEAPAEAKRFFTLPGLRASFLGPEICQ